MVLRSCTFDLIHAPRVLYGLNILGCWVRGTAGSHDALKVLGKQPGDHCGRADLTEGLERNFVLQFLGPGQSQIINQNWTKQHLRLDGWYFNYSV